MTLTLAYSLLGVAGLHWATIGGAGSPVWPAAGVALAGLLLGGIRLWPAILIGRLVAGVIAGSSQPFWVELLIAGGNVVGAVLPVLLLRRVARIDLRLISMRDVLWLAAAGGLGAVISGLIGTGTLATAHSLGWEAVLAVASNWWFGNTVGALTVAPLILAWHERLAWRGSPALRIPPGRSLHLAVMISATLLLAYLVFLTSDTLNLRTWHIYPVLIWAALAFQVRGAAVALVIVSAAALTGATLDLGPLQDLAEDRARQVFFAQQFAAVTSLTILILAAVADERRGKEALAQLNADLERRVQEGASRLAQLQKTESLGQLTGGIAHDFNNLLMAVQGSLELLKKRLPPNDKRAARLLANAMEGARRGATLTQRLLAFARKQELRPEPVGVPELVVGMADLLKRSLGPEVRIESHLPLGLPKAMVDANQLEMALLNLAVNARDAMPGGGTLTITAEETRVGAGGGLSPGPYISLKISDTGLGMDEATLRRATEPFFTTKGVGKGTGLGLAMVHGLAEQSGGRFTLRSEQGRGTRAELLLPVASVGTTGAREGIAQLAAATAGVSSLKGAASEPAAHRRSVLVVDDDVLVRVGTADMVEDLGYVPIEASSGYEAMEILRSGQPVDVVVTDHAMPSMTGVQLATTVRAEFPEIPVILASGYADLPPDEEGIISKRLSKPFLQPQLAEALSEALASSK